MPLAERGTENIYWEEGPPAVYSIAFFTVPARSCCFAGSPFQPCAPMYLGYITNGRRLGLNKKMFTGRVHFSWLSTYAMLPLHGQGIKDADDNELQYDFFDPDTWIREQWGIFHPDHPETVVGTDEFDLYRCVCVCVCCVRIAWFFALSRDVGDVRTESICAFAGWDCFSHNDNGRV